ncbi:MAG: tetratricopeptide repeat protein [Betaproteobacteria bacterium]|nr:MAG: tetratricopeptide repeat protein [Betaproteobacteria bacterium]
MTFTFARFARRTTLAVALCLGAGLSAAADRPDKAANELPPQELTPRTLYQLLLAEIAGARGQISLSTQLYLDLARNTRDPRIARRATEIAMFARNFEATSQAARIWAEIAPDSPDARRILSGVMAGTNGSLDDAQVQLARALATHPERLAQNLLGLNRALARVEDKQAVQAMVMRLTEPYLDLPEAHFARAQAAMIAQDPMEAVAALDTALGLRPDWEPAILFKAQVLQHAGAADEALKQIDAALARQPDNRNLQVARARAMVGAKRYEEARAEFRRLLEAAPDDRELLFAAALLAEQLNDRADAETQFTRALAAGHPEQDLIRLHLGQIAESRGDGATARKWFDEVRSPEHRAEAVIRNAQSLARENRLDDARQLLQREEGDEAARRRYVLAEAQLLRDADRPAEALAVVDAALRSRPDDVDLMYEAAMLAERLDRISIMETRLRRVIALKPDHAHAFNALGYSLADRGLRLKEAEALITRALQLSPDDPFILDSMGWVRFRRGDRTGALTHLERAYRMRQDPEIAAHLGEVLWSLQRRTDADRILDEAIAAHPDNKLLRDTAQRLRRK